MSHTATNGLILLPNEILLSTICLVSPKDATALARTSHYLLDVVYEPQIWRHYCLSRYRFWDEKWRSILKGKEAVDWRDVFRQKQQISRTVTSMLDRILDSQSGRINLFREISKFGYDAKDELLAQTGVSQGAEDYLSRRYWSKTVLDHLHRDIAVRQWQELGLNSHDSNRNQLERGLGAFDMFLIDEDNDDLDIIIQRLDDLVSSLLKDQPELMAASPRTKALGVATFLKSRSLVGITGGRGYHNIEHNFIGLVLSKEEHNSLPLISVVIFCYVAKKLGLRAQPCNFPFHVVAVVHSPSGIDLDGMTVPADSVVPPMYMDPWESGEEVPVDKLRSQLVRLERGQTPLETFLQQSSDNDIILRSARNILNSLREFRGGPPAVVDRSKAEYAALWAWLLLSPFTQDRAASAEQLHHGLPVLIHMCISNFPHDALLLKQYLLPKYSYHHDHLRYTETINSFCRKDRDPKAAKRRTSYTQSRLKYRIGQVFEHRRYGYRAAIVGWDTKCNMHEQWIQMMQVDQLSVGRDQCFYNAFVNKDSMRYVAEENIKIIKPERFEYPPASPFEAGKFFKRWDQRLHQFVSNMQDEYPDD